MWNFTNATSTSLPLDIEVIRPFGIDVVVSTILGIVLSLTSSVTDAIAMLVHSRAAHLAAAKAPSCVWKLLTLFLGALGAGAHIAAVSLTSRSLLIPLGTVNIIIVEIGTECHFGKTARKCCPGCWPAVEVTSSGNEETEKLQEDSRKEAAADLIDSAGRRGWPSGKNSGPTGLSSHPMDFIVEARPKVWKKTPWPGLLLIVGGVVALLIFGEHERRTIPWQESVEILSRPSSIGLVVTVVVLLAGLWIVAWLRDGVVPAHTLTDRNGKKTGRQLQHTHRFELVLFAALLGGFQTAWLAVLLDALVSEISRKTEQFALTTVDQVSLAILAVLLALSVYAHFRAISRMLLAYPNLSFVVPLYYTFQAMFEFLLDAWLYLRFADYSPERTGFTVGGFLVMIMGLVWVSWVHNTFIVPLGQNPVQPSGSTTADPLPHEKTEGEEGQWPKLELNSVRQRKERETWTRFHDRID